MVDDRDFREDIQRIGGLVQEIESIADPRHEPPPRTWCNR